jgi:hypothetical protein
MRYLVIALMMMSCPGTKLTGPSGSAEMEIWALVQRQCNVLGVHPNVFFTPDEKDFHAAANACVNRITIPRATLNEFPWPEYENTWIHIAQHECCHIALGHCNYDDSPSAEEEATACERLNF